jgi:hypothetical protein
MRRDSALGTKMRCSAFSNQTLTPVASRLQMDRYAGRPFLKLLECYVLDSIGQLHDDERNTLTKMEPNLRKTYNSKGSWKDIVHFEMGFPDSLPNTIRSVWEGYLKNAHEKGISVVPSEFARSFVDQNFVD